MKTEFTPGPWTLQAGRSIVTSSGSFYLTYGKDKNGNPNFRDFCELDRNAQLVASAPDLLAALEVIANSEEFDGDSFVCDFDTLQSVARAAIAKARGAS